MDAPYPRSLWRRCGAFDFATQVPRTNFGERRENDIPARRIRCLEGHLHPHDNVLHSHPLAVANIEITSDRRGTAIHTDNNSHRMAFVWTALDACIGFSPNEP